MAALSSSQCSGSSAGASAARGDCQPYSSNDFESFDSESEISSSREVGGRRRTVAVGNFRVVANADHRRPSRAHPWYYAVHGTVHTTVHILRSTSYSAYY